MSLSYLGKLIENIVYTIHDKNRVHTIKVVFSIPMHILLSGSPSSVELYFADDAYL